MCSITVASQTDGVKPARRVTVLPGVILKAAVAGAVAFLGLVSCGHAKMAEYGDAHDGWTLAYPASMHRTVIADYGRIAWRGVVIANSADVKPKQGEPTFRRFPPDGAALGILQRECGPAPDLGPPEARFPLTRSKFRYESVGPPPRPRVYGMIANGAPWAVYTWFGAKASRRDQERIWRIVESLRFPPQRPGTMSGRFYVLEDASHYPVGTVRRFAGKPSAYRPPFFLVHAPGGIYTVSWEPKFEPECHMAFDRPRFEFYCTTHRGRWDRMGRVVEGPASDLQYNDHLSFGETKSGRDGQVLVGNYSIITGSYRQYERQFWPRVKPSAGSR